MLVGVGIIDVRKVDLTDADVVEIMGVIVAMVVACDDVLDDDVMAFAKLVG